ncbi:MAG: class I SAM-dependent RNA methyltransferase [Candidatus Promineifilaceae bacterium]|jgi:23S rRNA (uracil1939-C5)-methyltransferase
MTELELQPANYAFGGAVVAHDNNSRPIFVQGALPGETVRAALTVDKERYAHAYVTAVIEPSPERVAPQCRHFGPCGGCAYQHIAYPEQLRAKRLVVADQLQRIGGLKGIEILPVIPSPEQWEYAHEAVFSPTAVGGLGYWSPRRHEVMPIEFCSITRSRIMTLFNDIDLDLPELRKLTLRLDSEEEILAALEVEDVEPPELEADFPVSVAIVLPDKTAASLIGDHYLLFQVKARTFRVSPGCFFQPNLPMAAKLVDTLLDFAALTGKERVLELYSGVGMLTAFLAQEALEVTAVEVNSDAVADLAVNLDDLDNVALYHGLVEEVLPLIADRPDLLVVDPGRTGLANPVIDQIKNLTPLRLIYIGSDLARTARDSKALSEVGYILEKVQPLDMHPQTYQVDILTLWKAS